MSGVGIALQPGGCGRALRTLTLLDGLDLPGTRSFHCGAADAALLRPELREGDQLEIAASVESWRESVLGLVPQGCSLLFVDCDLDQVPPPSRCPRVLATDRALVAGERDLAAPPHPASWDSLAALAQARVWWGEIAQVPGPERRQAMRASFHEAGFVSALARTEASAIVNRAEPRRLLLLRGPHSQFEEIARRARAADWGVDEVEASDPQPGLITRLQAASAAVIPGGLGVLAECAGLALPTLCLPTGTAEEDRALYFAYRLGIPCPAASSSFEGSIDALLRGETFASALERPDRDRQRQSVVGVVDHLRRRLNLAARQPAS